MTDILDTLKSYLDNPSAVMSKRVVNDVIDEIARLRVERDAVRAELADALVLAAQHLDCFRTERWELGNVMRERDALRALLREARVYVRWSSTASSGDMLTRIAAALNKGGRNE